MCGLGAGKVRLPAAAGSPWVWRPAEPETGNAKTKIRHHEI